MLVVTECEVTGPCCKEIANENSTQGEDRKKRQTQWPGKQKECHLRAAGDLLATESGRAVEH